MLRLNLRFRAAIKFHTQPTWILADLAGVSADRLADLVNEKCKPVKNDPDVLKVAKLLGFQPSDVFIQDEPDPGENAA